MLIEHRLDFRKDWLAANTSFRMGRVDGAGQLLPEQFTRTGHIDNHFSLGPAILWSPFLLAAHAGVILYDRLGGHVAADGFSKPYLVAMALGTAIYGFLAVLIAFSLARRYVPETSAFLGALGIWFGSSLPVYMYFNPSWSHAHSAFAVALFFWYWVRTRGERTWAQWVVLGALGGLMMDVYYVNAIVLLLPLLESLGGYWAGFQKSGKDSVAGLFLKNLTFAAVVVAVFSPTLAAKKIIYGSYLNFGYTEPWYWRSPAFFRVCFSSDHGLFSWTPILILSVAGLFCLRKYDKKLGSYALLTMAAFLYVIGCYADWDGISSFGNRFLVSLTVLFILGLAIFFDWLAHALQERLGAILAWSGATALVIWNLGLIFQWGLHMIPERGAVSWRSVAYNQAAVVPAQATEQLKGYLTRRKEMMDRIEQRDVNQIKSSPTAQ
jgi:Dolichyl-phosphate-mannose-protein mannosyltransferase